MSFVYPKRNKKYLEVLTLTRAFIISVLYANSFVPNKINQLLDEVYNFYIEKFKISIKKKKALQVIQGVVENASLLDDKIRKHIQKRSFESVDITALQILRAAVYEGFIGKLTPPKVAIDEYIKVAKMFLDVNLVLFISGVLGSIYKSANNEK